MNVTTRPKSEEQIFELIGHLFNRASAYWLNTYLDTTLDDWDEYATDGFGKEEIRDMTYYTHTLKKFIENMDDAWSRFKYEQEQIKKELCNPGQINLDTGLN